MSNNSNRDRWLLPRRQTEFPARDLLPEETLHARREATFLALAALTLAAAAALVVLGTSRIVDVSALVAGIAPDLRPVDLLLPLGVVPFGASLIASSLVCQLFGRRRARVLVAVSTIAAIALVGLMRVADVIDGGDAFGASLAFAAAYGVGHASNVFVFGRMRTRSVIVRTVVAASVATVLAWAACAGVLYAGVAPIADATIRALAIGSAVCSLACVLVLAIPAAAAARGLALALRVGRTLLAEAESKGRLPQAVIIDDDCDAPDRGGMRARRVSLQPFSSAEMRFFSEGDALAD